jgi:HJR/Mrr/RecB family endonuclease
LLAAYNDESNDELQQHELGELLSDEVENLVRTILPGTKAAKHRGYVELLVRLFRHANEKRINLEGCAGIRTLHELVQQAQELAPDLFRNYLSDKDQNDLSRAIYGLQFCRERKWLEGQPLDIAALCRRGENGRTPINIINIQELHSSDDKKRVLRQVIAAVYKYSVQNPRHSGPPSLLLYNDEIGTGYGERSVGKPEQTATHQVYRVLNRLVRQARKYGISVMLASQAYTDFNPDLRRQLGTKIIGKVDDRSEQFRVAQSIGEDTIGGMRDPREFVQAELPRLGPPRLLYIGVRGEAYTYNQLKCCTLDVVLHGRAVRRWREMYQQKTTDATEAMSHLFETGGYGDALEKVDEIANETCFITPLHSRVTALRGRCLIRLGRVSEAEPILEQADSNSTDPSIIEMGRELACWYREKRQRENYVRVLKRTAELASRADSKTAEEIQLELSKYNLFEARDPCAAEDNLKAISKSEDKKVTLFGLAWQKATSLFRSWSSAWGFVSPTVHGGEVNLIEPVTGQLAVEITVLPTNEDGAEEPRDYESELGKNPEILRISHILDNAKKHGQSFSSLGELSSFQFDYQTRLGRAQDLREMGRIRDAVNELEQLFKLPQTVVSNSQDIKRYDEDAEVRRVRVADWLRGLDWRSFEREVAILFTQMGYNAWATKPTGDDGVDVRALKENEKVVIQCKHWKRQNVGVDIVKALHATKEHEAASLAVIVTSSNLEPVAHRWAERCGIEVIEGSKLVDLFTQYCDPIRTKGSQNSRWQENSSLTPPNELATNPAFGHLIAAEIAARPHRDEAQLTPGEPENRKTMSHIRRSNQGERSGKCFVLKELAGLAEQYRNLRCSQCDSDATFNITNSDGVHIVCKKIPSHRERVDRMTLQRLADHLALRCRICGSTDLESKQGANIYLKCRNCRTNSSWEGISDRMRADELRVR